jgi:hypothetical protein
MKKKFLIALFVVVMSCFFAFTVNAANEVTLVGGATADLETVFKINGNNKTPAPILKNVANKVHTKSCFPILATAMLKFEN